MYQISNELRAELIRLLSATVEPPTGQTAKANVRRRALLALRKLKNSQKTQPNE